MCTVCVCSGEEEGVGARGESDEERGRQKQTQSSREFVVRERVVNTEGWKREGE